MERAEVYVSADLLGTGIEVRSADDPERNLVMTQPSDLGLSPDLVSSIGSWQWWFDIFANQWGLDRCFEVLGERFDEAGHQLAVRIAQELGERWRVIYEPQGGWVRRLGHGTQIVVQP